MSKDLILDVTIEIPKNSQIKYEFDRKSGKIRVDRILFGPSAYPQNYGFVSEALDWDGDELDVLVFANQEFLPGIIVPTRIVGAMEMIDGGETDTKLIGVIDCDPRWAHVKSLSDLSQHDLKVIKDFFETYKRLQNKTVLVNEFRDVEWAINDYNTCVELMNQYGSMDKEEFIGKMKQEHPEKYK